MPPDPTELQDRYERLRLLYQVSNVIHSTLDARDALEFIIAGASAVQVGTANFADPLIWPKLLKGLEAYLERHRIARISELTGTIDTTARDKEWISS